MGTTIWFPRLRTWNHKVVGIMRMHKHLRVISSSPRALEVGAALKGWLGPWSKPGCAPGCPGCNGMVAHSPGGSVKLEGEDDVTAVADLADEAPLGAQVTAVDVVGCKLQQ